MPAAQTIQSALNLLRARLERVSETAALDGQVLLAHILGRPRAWLLAHPEGGLSPAQAAGLEAALARLEAGEPLPYVLGEWEFYGLSFTISPAVLIPRPETELLVETALAWLETRSTRRLAADVGTGSGCIAIALAARTSGLRLVATDLSLPALRVAGENALRHSVAERVWPVQADLLPPLSIPFDLVCANLPYIPEETLAGLVVRRWEPALALSGGADGLDLVRRLLACLPAALAPGGLALLEIEAGQGGTALSLARAHFPAGQVSLLQDLAGRDRLVRIESSLP